MSKELTAPNLNFFLIGAAKGGTTTVHARLSLHPDVFMSPLKEPNFYAAADIDPSRFSTAFKAGHPDDLANYFATRPLSVRQIGFVRDPAQYGALFDAARPQHLVVGEASTTYLWSPSAPAAIAAAHPQAKIVICLREPVARLFSHYQMARKYGFTTESLLDAVATDQRQPDPSWGRSELFVELGLYAAQVDRWLAAFPAEQICILRTEQLSAASTWSQLQQWLGLEPRPLMLERRANTAGRARFERLNAWLTQSGTKQRIAPLLGRLLPPRAKQKVLGWYFTSKGLPQLTAADRAALEPIFAADQARLEEQLASSKVFSVS